MIHDLDRVAAPALPANLLLALPGLCRQSMMLVRALQCASVYTRVGSAVRRVAKKQYVCAAASASVPEPAPDASEPANVSKLSLWKMCIKPPMYTVGLAPMVTGAAVAYFTTGVFAGEVLKSLLLGSVLIIAWLNIRCGLNMLFCLAFPTARDVAAALLVALLHVPLRHQMCM